MREWWKRPMEKMKRINSCRVHLSDLVYIMWNGLWKQWRYKKCFSGLANKRRVQVICHNVSIEIMDSMLADKQLFVYAVNSLDFKFIRSTFVGLEEGKELTRRNKIELVCLSLRSHWGQFHFHAPLFWFLLRHIQRTAIHNSRNVRKNSCCNARRDPWPSP